jgi:two-component system, chemotaxis family, chemotaxis protein CheY
LLSILIIDDDQSIRETVAEALVDEGYSVLTAANGAEGLEVLSREPPALILLDMRMPVLDGWGFARALRERGLQLPILVMTAAQDAKRWAQEVGAVGAIPKPFNLVDLLDTVARTVQSS